MAMKAMMPKDTHRQAEITRRNWDYEPASEIAVNLTKGFLYSLKKINMGFSILID
jgi:hypothetical protein